MELHKIFDESLDAFRIKGKDLANKAGRSAGYISEVRLGKCGIPLEQFGILLEICEEMAHGFKRDFARRVGQAQIKSEKLALEDIALMIDSGRLSDDEVARISVELADVVVAISKRLKSSIKEMLSA